jgi:uncharacterized DUF497 family protein
MFDQFDGFDWDDGNVHKCQIHGVSIVEIEAVFGLGVRVVPDPRHSSLEQRLIAVNRNFEGRPLFVAFTIREIDGFNLVRPVSARYMHGKEIEKYEKVSHTQN